MLTRYENQAGSWYERAHVESNQRTDWRATMARRMEGVEELCSDAIHAWDGYRTLDVNGESVKYGAKYLHESYDELRYFRQEMERQVGLDEPDGSTDAHVLACVARVALAVMDDLLRDGLWDWALVASELRKHVTGPVCDL
jgi:hypothetical protein